MIKSVQTDLFAVIGNPVSHSLSPTMMNSLFQRINIPAVYLALQADSLEEDLSVLFKTGFHGLSVTLPHKETAYRLTLQTDDSARSIGAVNTLRRYKGGWEGRNTDWLGAVRALQQATALAGKRALVIGAGGVARAVIYGLKREKAIVSISNRTTERGMALATAFDCAFIPLSELAIRRRENRFEVVVQCTSAGLTGTGSSLELPHDFFQPQMVVMDTVYRPLWTEFITAAKDAGATLVHGLEMLLYQGVAQVEWWLGRNIPQHDGIDAMREALAKAVADENR